MQKVQVIGNLGKDPEIKTFESGGKVCNFSIAANEKWKDKNGETQEHTEWFNVQLWDRLADVAEKYLRKGSQIYIEGKNRTRTYEKDGQTNYITEVVVHYLEMLGSAPERTDAKPKPEGTKKQDPEEGKDDLPF